MNNKRSVPFPKTVDIALTGKCNLRCKHCNTSDTWDIKEELTFEEITEIFEQLKENKVFNLNLFGGEPFYHPGIFDLLEILNSFPMRLTILTNGTLIDEKTIKQLQRLKFLACIQISVDGSTSGIHDWQRGKGSFEGAINAVKMLLKNDLPVAVKAIINDHNHKDIENMVKMASALGLDGMDFGDAIECGRAAVYAGNMRFEGDMHRGIMEEMFRLDKKYPGFNLGGTLGQKMEMLDDFYKNGPGKGARGTFSVCPAAWDAMSVRSDGKVVPCSALWTLVCGDVREGSLGDIWKNSEELNEIRKLAEEPLGKYNSACNECDYLSYCNGGCRAGAYYSSEGDLRGIAGANCLVFSNLYGSRVSEETVLFHRS